MWLLVYRQIKRNQASTSNNAEQSKYLGWTRFVVDSSWNVMTYGDAREGKWRGNWWMERVANTLHATTENGVSSITTADANLPVVDWTDAPADLNWLVRFAERQNLVSARVPSHFNWPLRYCFLVSSQSIIICVRKKIALGEMWNDVLSDLSLVMATAFNFFPPYLNVCQKVLKIFPVWNIYVF